MHTVNDDGTVALVSSDYRVIFPITPTVTWQVLQETKVEFYEEI